MTGIRPEAASQISVSENRGLTSALHPIAAVRVVGFWQAVDDPLPSFKVRQQRGAIAAVHKDSRVNQANPLSFFTLASL